MIQLAKNLLCAAILLLVVFLGLLVLVCAIPSSWVNTHLGDSVATMKKEGLYPSIGFPWRKIVLDNFTDGVMLNIAYSVDSSQPARSAIRNVQHDSNDNSADQIHNLEMLSQHRGVHETVYERYWHGYLIFLRPILAVTSYAGVRVVLTILLFGTFAAFMLEVWKRLGVRTTFALLAGFIAVDFFWLGSSIQLSNVFITGMLGSLYLLRRRTLTFLQVATTFFVVGAVTSYIDVLSAPLVSLGLLLVTAVGLVKKMPLKKVLILCVLWSAGYLALWAGKWVIAQYTFVPNAVSNGYRKLQDRTMGTVDAEFSRTNAVVRNFYQLRGYDKRDKIQLLVIGIGYFLFVARYFSKKSVNREKLLIWMAVAVIPYLWYFIAAEHSYIHVLFTYRDQFMTVVAAFFVSTEFIDWQKLQKDAKLLKRHTHWVQ